jgi:hypothetical protein
MIFTQQKLFTYGIGVSLDESKMNAFLIFLSNSRAAVGRFMNRPVYHDS